jgi:hypothetical protein
MPNYDISQARYAKGKFLIRIEHDGSPEKRRAERLLTNGLNCRYTGREDGFIASPSQSARFEKLYAEGWDACFLTGELRGPNGEQIINKARSRDLERKIASMVRSS